MKVLGLYAEDYPWDVRVEKLMRGFAAAGFEAHLLCRNLARRPLTEDVNGLVCHRVVGPDAGLLAGPRSIPAPFNPVWKRRLDGLLRELEPTLVVVRDVPLAVGAIRAAHRRGVPVLVDMAENHPAMWASLGRGSSPWAGNWLLKNPAFGRRLERLTAAEADLVFVVVEEMRDHLLAVGCPPERVVVVSNTPPRAVLAHEADPAAGDGALDIVYVGHVTTQRGLQDVVHALSAIGPGEPPIRLHVAGRGAFEEGLRSLAAERVPGDRVVFHGWVDSTEVPALIARCNVGVIPHVRNEHTDTTIPNKIFDYMAAGLPVIVSDALPLRRLVAEEGCGLSYTSGDAESLAGVIRALRDPGLRRRLGAAGRAAVERRYHWEWDLRQATEAIRELVGAPS